MKFEDPRTQQGLQEALDVAGNTHSLGNVTQMIIDGRAQLWESEDAVIVTEIHEFPAGRAVHLWLATGELGGVVELSKLVLAWARTVGCTSATITGRKGWERVGALHGWRPLYTVLGQGIGYGEEGGNGDGPAEPGPTESGLRQPDAPRGPDGI